MKLQISYQFDCYRSYLCKTLHHIEVQLTRLSWTVNIKRNSYGKYVPNHSFITLLYRLWTNSQPLCTPELLFYTALYFTERRLQAYFFTAVRLMFQFCLCLLECFDRFVAWQCVTQIHSSPLSTQYGRRGRYISNSHLRGVCSVVVKSIDMSSSPQ